MLAVPGGRKITDVSSAIVPRLTENTLPERVPSRPALRSKTGLAENRANNAKESPSHRNRLMRSLL
jgi:hypothetical protein